MILLSRIMKRLKRYIAYVGIGLTLFSCKKEHLQPNNGIAGTPVFYFNGIVNSAPVSLQAGVNNYYMYSSYTQDVNNVYNYTGTLQTIGCTTCSNSIKITLNDYRTRATGGSESQIDSSLLKGSYVYYSPSGGTPIAYTVKFTPTLGSGTATKYTYSFGDGGTYSGGTAVQTHTYARPGTYNTLLKVNFTSGVDSIQVQNQSTSSAPLWNSLLKYNSYDSTIGKLVYFDSVTSGSTPYSISWNFGDGKTSNRNITSYKQDTATHVYASSGLYQVSVTLTDSNNYSHTDVQKFIVKDSASFTPGPYISTLGYSNPTGIANSDAFSNITIVYTDGSGDTYTSANVVQPASSYFNILSVSNYQNNENNQTTKQLHVQFNCMLQDGSGKKIPVTNGDAVIAVAYK